MKTLPKILGTALALSAVVLLTGCGSQSDDDNTIRVGTMAGPETALMETAAEVAQDQYGLNVEITEFNDYVSPNAALDDGSIDANAYQHQPYLDSMMEDRGFDFAAAGRTFVYPIGAYSDKYESIDELPEGATIAVPNDPSNEARALLLLARENLITLRDPQSPTATPDDITDNPHNYQLRELDAAQLTRALPDVDMAFINSTYSVAADMSVDQALIVEDGDSPYVNLIVVRQGDQNSEKVQHLVEAFQSQQVIDRAEELFQGGAIAGWENNQ
ncbi:MetQ/NlpA family ABC transporter substrate-binding protein [Kushneria sp. TE3]|uniref:MetQ/NlpA family ABC transporter substrate-binding protein n=1 Tax=Kushneria sp. TE3 TaxID=3449832 RepID=UPI003F68865A